MRYMRHATGSDTIIQAIHCKRRYGCDDVQGHRLSAPYQRRLPWQITEITSPSASPPLRRSWQQSISQSKESCWERAVACRCCQMHGSISSA